MTPTAFLDSSDVTSCVDTSAPDEAFIGLKAAFLTRLGIDHARLVQLRKGLLDTDPSHVADYRTIRLVAHRMAGAAAIFEHEPLARLAHRLETAALNADATLGPTNAASVRTALQTLIDLLAAMVDHH